MLGIIVGTLQRLKWSIRYKIGLAFSLVLFLFILNGCISAWLLLNIKQTEDRQHITDTNLEQLQRYDLTYNSQLELYGDAIFVIRSPYFRNNFGNFLVSSQLSNNKDNSNEASKLFKARFARLYIVALDHFQELEKYIRTQDFEGGKLKWREFSPDFDKITQLIIQRREELTAQQANDKTELENSIFLSLGFIVGLTVFSILLVLFVVFLIGRVLVKPLNKLQQGLNRLALGDLEQQLDIINQDELGQLANSFRQAILSLQQVLRGVQISESLQHVTYQLAAVSRQQSEGAAEQVISLGEVQHNIEELSQSASLIAARTVSVAGLTGTTLEQIERVALAGQTSQMRTQQMVNVVETTLAGIEQVGQQVTELSLVMNELNGQSDAISTVVNLVGSIANEVHLLALNASIEAAGAGEYGDRFQVIARHIKQLASRANQANQQASDLITTVQSSTRRALSQVEDDQARVLNLVEYNSTLRQTLQELSQSIEQVNGAVTQLHTLADQVSQQTQEIKLATQQQSRSSEQVISSARLAGQVAEQTASNCEQLTGSSGQLESLTDQLNGVLKLVRLSPA